MRMSPILTGPITLRVSILPLSRPSTTLAFTRKTPLAPTRPIMLMTSAGEASCIFSRYLDANFSKSAAFWNSRNPKDFGILVEAQLLPRLFLVTSKRRRVFSCLRRHQAQLPQLWTHLCQPHGQALICWIREQAVFFSRRTMAADA